MSADPTWLAGMHWTDYQRDECKHCGLEIRSATGEHWRHAEGPQRGKNRCAVEPYGYDAAPAHQPCSFACLGSTTGNQGSRGMTRDRLIEWILFAVDGYRFGEWSLAEAGGRILTLIENNPEAAAT